VARQDVQEAGAPAAQINQIGGPVGRDRISAVAAHIGGTVRQAAPERSSLSVKPLLDRGKLNLPAVAATAAHPIVDS
jgi:hypothetical protein